MSIEIKIADRDDLAWIVQLYQQNSKQQLDTLQNGFVQDHPDFEEIASHWLDPGSYTRPKWTSILSVF